MKNWRVWGIFSLFGVTICLTGCFTLDHAMTPNGKEHILCKNYGWSLFGAIPLFCGNATPGAWFPWVMFRDDVTMDKLQGRVTDYAASQGHSATSLTYFNEHDVLFEIPGTQIPIPIPYVVTYREVQISGELR